MGDKAKTYGEFIAAMEEVAVEISSVNAEIFLEQWKALATEEDWQKFRPMLLTKELVLRFAEDMALYYAKVISRTETKKLYVSRVEDGHAFLREIHAKAKAFGIDIEIEEIDVPLTPTDSIVATGAAQVVAEAK